MREIAKYVTGKAVGKALIRFFGFPAAVASGIFSAYQTIKSRKELKEFDAKYIQPLRGECDKWQNAQSQLEGAVHEHGAIAFL